MAGVRNPERDNGKAWSKGHVAAPAKILSPEAAKSKAEKDRKRLTRPPQADRGSSVTWPKVTWDWCMETMAGRHVGTRRYRTIEDILTRQRRGAFEAPPREIEPNPEIKIASKSRKNGK